MCIRDSSDLSIDDISYLVNDSIDLHVIGVGSSKGSLIPILSKQNSFLKDESGELVLSKIDLNFLREISLLNNGKLLRISKSEPISENIIDIIKYRFNMGVLSIHNLRSFISKYKVAMMVVVAGFASNMVVKGLMKSVGELWNGYHLLS